MDSMQNKNDKYTKTFLNCAVISLKKLGCSENNIKRFLNEMNNHIELLSIQETTNNIDTFTNIDMKKVVFEEIEIPIEYNIMLIGDLFEKHGFTKKEYGYVAQRICNALAKKQIVYIKDLHDKSKKDIIGKSIGEESYNFFVRSLKEICNE